MVGDDHQIAHIQLRSPESMGCDYKNFQNTDFGRDHRECDRHSTPVLGWSSDWKIVVRQSILVRQIFADEPSDWPHIFCNRKLHYFVLYCCEKNCGLGPFVFFGRCRQFSHELVFDSAAGNPWGGYKHFGRLPPLGGFPAAVSETSFQYCRVPDRLMFSSIKKSAKHSVASGIESLVGRRNLYRVAQFLLNHSRLDSQNNMEVNGEIAVQACVLNAVKTEPIVVFDIGANIGLWSESILKLSNARHQRAISYAFEPCQETFSAMTARLELLSDAGSLVAVQKGCSSKCGRTILNIVAEGNCGANSVVPGTRRHVLKTEEIELTTIDAYVFNHRIDHIHLIKIDAEGHDLEVIRGGIGLFKQRAIEVVQFEYNRSWISARNFLRDAFEFFTPLEYLIGKVTPRGVEFYDTWYPQLESFIEGNYIACTTDAKGYFPFVKPELMH